MEQPRHFSVDLGTAPITATLAMKYQMMHAEISGADPATRSQRALDEMYEFLGDVLIAIHQLETGQPPLPASSEE